MQNFAQQLPQFIAKLPQKKLSQIALLLIVIYLAFLSAKLFWLLWPSAEQDDLVTMNSGQNQSVGSKSNQAIDSILALNLFGTVQSAPKVRQEPKPITDAPETNLNISLTGVVAINQDDQAGLVIIESQGSQESYKVNEVVKGTRARVKQVFADRVILQLGTRYETLMLDGVDFSQQPAEPIRANLAKTEPQKKLNTTISQAAREELMRRRQEFLNEPGKLFDYIRVSPHRVQGELKGYRLRPGKDPELFKEMGLKNNDLATAINGFMLTDIQQSMMAINELRNATSATIVVDRQGEQIDINFSLEP